MTHFVTGATGFIGRHVVARLLQRGAVVHALVRDPSAAGALTGLPGAGRNLRLVTGDLTRDRLGITHAEIRALRGEIEHVLHVGGLYDLDADPARLEEVNVDGTRNALALAAELGAGTFHHVSSIAIAGNHEGTFTEAMFDAGQDLPSDYHRTKFEAERLVRAADGAWRIYRPGVVVGDSRTGAADKADGPYGFFKAIQKLRGALPQWFPLIGPELGHTNLVPVDYVADAIDFLAHRPGLDGRAFHLVASEPQRVADVLNTFAEAAHAPRLALRIDLEVLGARPSRLARALAAAPGLAGIRRQLLADLGIPEALFAHVALKPRFDAGATRRELAGTGIEVPALDSYAWRLWDHWERHMDPDLAVDDRLAEAVRDRVAVVTGASSGIGRAVALRLAAAGATCILVARSVDRLEELRAEIEALGGRAEVAACDLSDTDAIEALVDRVLGGHGGADVLVNNAGRSIRRSTSSSYERFHDFERTIALNYLGAVKLTMGLLPGMRERGRGHVVNVSSIGVQANPPRFSAYVASKAALDAWTRVVSSEAVGDGVAFTTVHMPLVRTPMIAPTRIYDSFPAISPEEAAELVCDAIRRRPKSINTRLGTISEVAYALAPKLVDQVLHRAYAAFPDSPAARGDEDDEEAPTPEARILAHLMRGVYW